MLNTHHPGLSSTLASPNHIHVQQWPHDHGPCRIRFDMLLGHVALGAFHDSSERFEPPPSAIQRCERPSFPRSRRRWSALRMAIAQSISELCEALPPVCLFFSRTPEGRSDRSRLVVTVICKFIVVPPINRAKTFCMSSFEEMCNEYTYLSRSWP